MCQIPVVYGIDMQTYQMEHIGIQVFKVTISDYCTWWMCVYVGVGD